MARAQGRRNRALEYQGAPSRKMLMAQTRTARWFMMVVLVQALSRSPFAALATTLAMRASRVGLVFALVM